MGSSKNGSGAARPDAEALGLDIDLRIGLEAWAELWKCNDQGDAPLVASLLRFAYGRGYYDALAERQRGKLCLDHGFAVPERIRHAL